jgi:DNA-binding transcriptional LysR family regulator
MDWHNHSPHIRGLMALRAVAENGTFTRAAKALGWNQPNVSKHLQALEKRLGTRLLRRDRAGTDLTGEGARVLEHAVRITDACAELADSVAPTPPPAGANGGPLRIAASPTLGHHWLPRALPELQAAVPDQPLQYRVLRGRGALRRLARGQADLALVEQPPADADLVAERVGTDHLVAACHPSHPWADLESLSLPDFLRARHVLREPGCELREGLERRLRQEGRPGIVPDREVGSQATLLHHLRQGEHLTVTSAMALESGWGTELTALTIRDLDLSRPLWAVHSPQDLPREGVAAILDLVRRQPLAPTPDALAHGPTGASPARDSLTE